MPATSPGPGRPDADECLPYYFEYIKLVPDGHVVDLLERQIAESRAYLAAAANFAARSLGDVVAELAAVRAAFVALLRGLDAAAWDRRAPADWTLRSVRAVAYCMAGHELHHLADIRRQHGATAV